MESWSTLTQTTYGPRLIDLIDAGYDLGLDDYPIFDEAYRPTLNQAIIDHFLVREIAAETPALFIFYLNRRMRENMPKANALYRFYQENADHMVDEYNRTSTGTDTGTSRGTGTNSSDAEAYTSTTPQYDMTGRSGEAYYTNGSYNKGSGSSSSDNSTESNYEHHEIGRNAGVAAVAADFIEMFQDVEQVVFAFLEPCFCQLYTDHVNGL